MEIKFKKLWAIYCATGCTCCSYENFTQGFYEFEIVARAVIAEYEQGIGNPLGSQFARYGRYYLQEYEAELLPNGRMIVDDEVYDQGYFGRIYD